MKSSKNYQNIKKSLSAPRLTTYERHAKDTKQALELYRWNLQMSSALFECLSVCEVVIRNSVINAIQAIYGHCWAWDSTFLASLQNSPKPSCRHWSSPKNNGLLSLFFQRQPIGLALACKACTLCIYA